MQSINNKFLVFENDQNLEHHFELPWREQKVILGSVTGWYLQKKKKIFSIIYLPRCILAPVQSPEPEILNTSRLVYF